MDVMGNLWKKKERRNKRRMRKEERRIGEQSEVILLYKYTEHFHHSLCLPKSLMFITGKAQSENIK